MKKEIWIITVKFKARLNYYLTTWARMPDIIIGWLDTCVNTKWPISVWRLTWLSSKLPTGKTLFLLKLLVSYIKWDCKKINSPRITVVGFYDWFDFFSNWYTVIPSTFSWLLCNYAWDFGYKIIEVIQTTTMPQSSQVGISYMNH